MKPYMGLVWLIQPGHVTRCGRCQHMVQSVLRDEVTIGGRRVHVCGLCWFVLKRERKGRPKGSQLKALIRSTYADVYRRLMHEGDDWPTQLAVAQSFKCSERTLQRAIEGLPWPPPPDGESVVS